MIGIAGGIRIPMTVDEITFENFCIYQQLEREWMSSEEKELGLVNLVKHCYEIEDVSDIPYIPEKLPDGYVFKLGDEVTMIRLYLHYVNLINSFNPEIGKDFKVRYKGEDYFVDANDMMTAVSDAAYTTGEVVTICEYQRLLKKDPEAFDASTEMKIGLIEMAVLLRKKGERLPLNQAERDAFISKRARHFAELPMDAVLSVRFFLLGILEDCAKISVTNIFGKGKGGLKEMKGLGRLRIKRERSLSKFGNYLGGILSWSKR